jgi:hypothetical protein
VYIGSFVFNADVMVTTQQYAEILDAALDDGNNANATNGLFNLWKIR